MHTLTADRQTLCDCIPRLKGQRVLVVGDVMLDVYFGGECERISPEAPVPVVNIVEEHRRLGGAANVAHNIARLGGRPHLVGLCGVGADGDCLERLLDEADIAASLLHSSARATITKTRVMARGQQMLRLDKEKTAPLNADERERLLALLEGLLPDYGVLILSDYAKGLVTKDFCEALEALRLRQARPCRVLIDPKPANAACYHGAWLLTPNRREAAELAGMPLNTPEDIQEAGRRLLQRYDCAQLLITLGGQGMALFMRDGSVWNIPTAARAVYDVTGAGDTVIATIGLALAAGAVLPVACALANYAAGEAVQQVGVGTLDQEQLLRMVRGGVPLEFIPWGASS